VLGRGSRGTRSTVSKAASRALVTVEVAAAVLLVAGAALMIRSFARLSTFDLGFDPSGFVTMEVQPVDPGAQTFATYRLAEGGLGDHRTGGRTTPHDPLAFAAVAITLAAGGALAAWIPARRAATVDPVVALRAD